MHAGDLYLIDSLLELIGTHFYSAHVPFVRCLALLYTKWRPIALLRAVSRCMFYVERHSTLDDTKWRVPYCLSQNRMLGCNRVLHT